MKHSASAFLALICMLAPTLAFAHPGHGETDPDSWLHYLTEPVHVVVLVAALSLALVAIGAWRRQRQRKSQD